MKPIAPLAPDRLYRPCDTDRFTFDTTDDLEDLTEGIGQMRAIDAAHFGIGMRHAGYNRYVMGQPGRGKRTLVRQLLNQRVMQEPKPADWCYVHNFSQPHKPRAIQSPEAAERLHLRWSFRVTRGRVAAEMQTHAQAFDLVVLGKRTGISVVRVTRTTLTGVHPNLRAGSVLVLFEDASTSARSLELGATLARRHGVELVLLVSAGNQEAYQAACADAWAALKSFAVTGRCTWLPVLDSARLVEVAQRKAAGCLILSNRERFLTQSGFERMLDEIECPTVLTR